MSTENDESTKKQDAFDKAMTELNDLEKSTQDVVEDDIDVLTKALEAELGEDLSKAKKDDGDDSGPDGDKDDKEDDDGGDPDLMDKSFEQEEYDEELVKASAAFADLEKSVQLLGDGFALEMASLRKSMAAMLNLTIKQAKVVASLAKSRDDTRVLQ